MTRIVHGHDAVDRAERASSLLFAEGIAELNVEDVLAVFEDVPSSSMAATAFEGDGAGIADLLVTAGLASSKGEAARLVRGGGVYVNNRRIGNERERLVASQAIGGRVFVLRKGRQQQHVVRVEE